MGFGFFEEVVNELKRFFIANFWSLAIVVVLIISIYFYFRIVKKVSIFALFTMTFPKEMKIGGVPIIINRRNKKLAYNIWVELKTRKIAIDFDEENDVIVEIYDSWYVSFKLIREYIKGVGEKRINASLRDISIKIINESMREHLTIYQAKFRKWYEKKEDQDISPQEIQKQCPYYNKLIADLKRVNQECKKYLELLEEIYE